MGTTPFNLVFRLNTILPIKFLIPTLCIAQTLEWTGHELSQRVADLEQLDETRQQAVAGMYAEKRRQKRWHDKNLRTQEFHKGTLVLLYTLKKNKRKLKMQGLGLFVINDITADGAVRLEPMDSTLMASYSNGSCLQIYHEPLATEMLERLHASEQRKIAEEQLKQSAQQETRERAAKAKLWRLSIAAAVLNKNNTEEEIQPPTLIVRIECSNNHWNTLLDSGAAVNVMSIDLYNTLCNKQQTPTATQFSTFNNQ